MKIISVSLLLAFAVTFLQAQDKPNILWIVSEDNSPFIGAYGDVNAITPHIDALAKQGVLYENAYCTAPVCAPSRSTLITGMYPPSIGTENMRSEYVTPGFVKFFPAYLKAGGYYTTNNAKKDYNTVDQPDVWHESGNKATYKNRKEGQPFFAVFNINTSHESSIFRQEEKRKMLALFQNKPEDSIRVPPDKPLKHDPKKMIIPPYLPPIPEMKHDWAAYYDRMTEMDGEVGNILKALEEEGLTDNTIVFYYADNGGVLGRSKRFVFESGLHVPLVIRFPERYKKWAPVPPGSRVSQLVDFTDFGATVLSLAGIQPPEYMQGQAFLGAYAVKKEREIVFGFRGRMDERMDLVRSVKNKQYRYVKNFMPHRIYGQHVQYLWLATSMQAWEKAFHEGKLNDTQSAFFRPKPSEELYDAVKDPDNIHNLALQKEYAPVLEELRKQTRRLLVDIRDVGFIPEAAAEEINKTTTLYDYARSGKYDIEKVLHIATLASSRDKNVLQVLVRSAADRDPVIRYWAATGLLVLAQEGITSKNTLQQLLNDDKLYVGIPAAEALYYLGEKKMALQKLYDALKSSSVMTRVQALNALQGAEKAALEPVQNILEDIVRKKASEYDRKAAEFLLDKLKS